VIGISFPVRYLLVAFAALLVTAPAAARVQLPSPPRAGVLGTEHSVCARRTLGSARIAYAAVVRRSAVVYRAPRTRPFATFGRLNVNRVPTVFGARGAACGGWLNVQLPIRPNGTMGWVRTRDVSLFRISTRIVVDVSARRLVLLRRGHAVLRTPAAVGAPGTPTPLGRYYANQRLIPSNPGGPFGPAAIGVSAFSDVLTGWAQGGPIGIHGTNEPWSIGRAVSNGCIRVPNAVMRRLFAAVPTGTPVIIRA
jgi:lipoprotein-anchoring transpeptidase ErfK/SrfK